MTVENLGRYPPAQQPTSVCKMDGHAKRSFSHTEAKKLRAITSFLRELALVHKPGMRHLPTKPDCDLSEFMRIMTARRATALKTKPRHMLSTITKHPPRTKAPRVIQPAPVRPNATHQDCREKVSFTLYLEN